MHVDGFRFDLASLFTRNPDGSVNANDVPLLSDMASDPDLAHLRLIAEPWDAAGVYQLGRAFPGIMACQWNGRYRDDLRRFVKGDPGMVPALMRRLYGSDDLFPDDRMNAYHPYQSVNYITSHDGFTLYDLVAYNQKRNWANGHGNTDGTDGELQLELRLGRRRGCAAGGGEAAQATDQEFLLPAVPLERDAHVPRRRRVHAHAGREQQSLQSGQRSRVGSIGAGCTQTRTSSASSS